MHKLSFLRTNKSKMCNFMSKYLCSTQKIGTFAAVFVENAPT